MCLPTDTLNYGIEVTGWGGSRLLNGKYFTPIYAKEIFNKAISLDDYYNEQRIRMQKLFLSFKEGILPEMNDINSLDKFIRLFDQSTIFFFGEEFKNTTRYTLSHKYIIDVYTCLKGDFQKGIQELMQFRDTLDPTDPQESEMRKCFDMLLNTRDGEKVVSHESFCENYEALCNERRRKLKIIR